MKGIKVKAAVLICISLTAGIISSCGGQSNSTNLVAYNFSAQVEYYSTDQAPFPAAVGDIITGTLSYDPSATDQKAPAGVQVNIRNVTLNSNLGSSSDIVIWNDVTTAEISVDGIATEIFKDMFRWNTIDTQTASQYSLGYIETEIRLDDTTATVFSNTLLPTALDLNSFTNATVYFGKSNPNGGTALFGSAKIISLTPAQ